MGSYYFDGEKLHPEGVGYEKFRREREEASGFKRMIEIEEVVPQYKMIDSEETTPNAFYAKRQDSVIIFNAFMDRFYCYVDDYGRLICTERVKKDESINNS